MMSERKPQLICCEQALSRIQTYRWQATEAAVNWFFPVLLATEVYFYRLLARLEGRGEIGRPSFERLERNTQPDM